MIRYAQSRRTKVSCLTWWPRPSHLSLLLHWHCSRSLQLRQDGLEEQKDWVYFADELGEYVDASRKGISVAVVGLKVTVISSLSSLLPILDSSHSRLEPMRSPLLKRITILLLSSLLQVLFPKALLQWTSCKQISTWELFFRESDLRTLWLRKTYASANLLFFFSFSVDTLIKYH